MPIYTTDEMSVEEFTEMVRQHPVKFEPLPARFWEDERWLFEHIAELTEQYPDQWVVVYKKQVIGVAGGRRGLTEAKEQAQHIVDDGGPLVTFFLESKPYVYPTGSVH
jgi:hypothetical protein